MKLLCVLLLAACSPTPATVSGIPDGVSVTCDGDDYERRRFCVGGGAVYFCVRGERDGHRHFDCAPVRSLAELEQP